jgi:gamma-glutamylcyclotransferase (GGCT)/AIG2-like uncharacterized protein YtfP
MTLMFAYGSNLNIDQMSWRCPDAQPLGRIKLPDWRLVFRGVADVIQEPGAVCYGGVWRITKRCEAALDLYEGISSRLYRKEYIRINPLPDGERRMLVYVMNSTGIMPPSASYLECIRQGYRDHGMPREAHRMLARAVRQSWDDKAPSWIERRRAERNGHPQLARA